MVAAVGRLDVGEVGALAAQLFPIDIALQARDIDAVNGQMPGRGLAEVDRLGIAKAIARDRPGKHRRRARQPLRR